QPTTDTIESAPEPATDLPSAQGAGASSVPPGLMTAPSLARFLESRDAGSPTSGPATPTGSSEDERLRACVAAEARAILEGRKRFRDCSAFILGANRAVGITLQPMPLPAGRSMSESLYRASTQVPVARLGDIAVFHDT